jgi:ribosomal protein L1
MTLINKNQQFTPEEVFEKIDEMAKKRNFDESIEAIVKLNVDPTKGD